MWPKHLFSWKVLAQWGLFTVFAGRTLSLFSPVALIQGRSGLAQPALVHEEHKERADLGQGFLVCVEWGWRGKVEEGAPPRALSESSALVSLYVLVSYLWQCNLIPGKQSSFISPFPLRTATRPRREGSEKGAG